MMEEVRSKIDELVGQNFAGKKVIKTDDFSYTDPVDNSKVEKQGIRILFEDQSRIIFRLSGTGTSGATLRLYLERFRNDGGTSDINEILEPLRSSAVSFLGLRERFGVEQATVIT